jgi:hypothetical protein
MTSNELILYQEQAISGGDLKTPIKLIDKDDGTCNKIIVNKTIPITYDVSGKYLYFKIFINTDIPKDDYRRVYLRIKQFYKSIALSAPYYYDRSEFSVTINYYISSSSNNLTVETLFNTEQGTPNNIDYINTIKDLDNGEFYFMITQANTGGGYGIIQYSELYANEPFQTPINTDDMFITLKTPKTNITEYTNRKFATDLLSKCFPIGSILWTSSTTPPVSDRNSQFYRSSTTWEEITTPFHGYRRLS